MPLNETAVLSIYCDLISEINSNKTYKNPNYYSVLKDILMEKHFSDNVISFEEMNLLQKELAAEIKNNAQTTSKALLLANILARLYKQIDPKYDQVTDVNRAVEVENINYCYISENYRGLVNNHNCEEFMFNEYINIKFDEKFIDVTYQLQHNAHTRLNCQTEVCYKKLIKCRTNLKSKQDFDKMLSVMDKQNIFFSLCKKCKNCDCCLVFCRHSIYTQLLKDIQIFV